MLTQTCTHAFAVAATCLCVPRHLVVGLPSAVDTDVPKAKSDGLPGLAPPPPKTPSAKLQLRVLCLRCFPVNTCCWRPAELTGMATAASSKSLPGRSTLDCYVGLMLLLVSTNHNMCTSDGSGKMRSRYPFKTGSRQKHGGRSQGLSAEGEAQTCPLLPEEMLQHVKQIHMSTVHKKQ